MHFIISLLSESNNPVLSQINSNLDYDIHYADKNNM